MRKRKWMRVAFFAVWAFLLGPGLLMLACISNVGCSYDSLIAVHYHATPKQCFSPLSAGAAEPLASRPAELGEPDEKSVFDYMREAQP